MIDKNDAPEGMIAVKPVEIVSCCGCYYWETGSPAGVSCKRCCPNSRKDGQFVIFIKKDQK